MTIDDMNIKLVLNAFDAVLGKEGDQVLKEEIESRKYEDRMDYIRESGEQFKPGRFHSMTEDERLDDSRHGQSESINRSNRDAY